MKNNKIANAYDEIEPDDYAKQRVWSKVTAERPRKRRTIPILATTATVLAIALIAYSLFPAQIANSFTVRAYAIGQHEDGTIARLELDISAVNEAGGWSGFFDGEFLYLNIFFDVSGENIASADFSIENGFFAKQYIDFGTTQSNVVDRYYNVITAIYDNVIGATLDEFGNVMPFLFNTEIIPLGNRVALEDMQVENYLYFLAVPYRLGNDGIEIFYFDDVNTLEIQIGVVFHDGERQSEAIALDFYDRWGAINHHPDLGDIGCFSLADISLDDATLIPESVYVLPPYDDVHGMWGEQMFIWERENGDILVSRRLFREPGFEQRYRFSMVDGNAVMPVVRLDENGDFVGMEYILPDEIARNFREFWVSSIYYMPQ